jgi:hypothetical protein
MLLRYPRILNTKYPSKKFPKDVLIAFLDKSTFELFTIHVGLWRWGVGIGHGSDVNGSPKLPR